MDKKTMLMQLIQQYEDGNKTRFAKRIGLTPQGISTWLSRGTIDYELVYAKCESLNAAWLLTGHGSMLRSDQEQPASQPVIQSTPPGEDSFIYSMYKEEKEGKEALIEEIGGLKERIRTLEEKISTYQDKEPDSPTAASLVTEAFTEEPSGDSTKDYIHTRKPTTTKRSSDLKT